MHSYLKSMFIVGWSAHSQQVDATEHAAGKHGNHHAEGCCKHYDTQEPLVVVFPPGNIDTCGRGVSTDKAGQRMRGAGRAGGMCVVCAALQSWE